ncbi:MAG: copper homeostasis protein CutC [Gemmatimonadaceae bacterium]
MAVEVCIDAVGGALVAEESGAARVELCADLARGGTTPSAGMIAAVRSRTRLGLFVMVRPRPGDFLYSVEEIDVMERDIAAAKALGATGVVVGALTAHGDVDIGCLRTLVAAARPAAVTFHRAFDAARDAHAALETLMAEGVDRVLTAGGPGTAVEGVAVLRDLVARAGRTLVVMPGGGVTGATARYILEETGARELHVRCAHTIDGAMEFRRKELTFGAVSATADHGRVVTNAACVREVVAATR